MGGGASVLSGEAPEERLAGRGRGGAKRGQVSARTVAFGWGDEGEGLLFVGCEADVFVLGIA